MVFSRVSELNRFRSAWALSGYLDDDDSTCLRGLIDTLHEAIVTLHKQVDATPCAARILPGYVRDRHQRVLEDLDYWRDRTRRVECRPLVFLMSEDMRELDHLFWHADGSMYYMRRELAVYHWQEEEAIG